MGSKGTAEPIESIEFDKLRLNPSLCTHSSQKDLLLILIVGFQPHFSSLIGSIEPIQTILNKNLRVVNLHELKLREEGIPYTHLRFFHYKGPQNALCLFSAVIKYIARGS